MTVDKKDIKELEEENRLLKKLIENHINIDRIDEVVSMRYSPRLSRTEEDFILGCWEYDRADQIFIVDDVLKNFLKLESNVMTLDFYREMIPEGERDEVIDTILLSFENKITSLKFENRIINHATGFSYSTLTLMNNFYDENKDTVKSEGFVINITALLIGYQHSRAKLSNEKYIDNVAVMLNSYISQDRVINFTLKELKRYRPSRHVNLIQDDGGVVTVYTAGSGMEGQFYSVKAEEREINIDWDLLEKEGFQIINIDENGEFFSSNDWIDEDNKTLIVIPGRIDRHVKRVAFIDVTFFFDTVTTSDILTYQAIVHIFEGTLKRIEEEFLFHQNELQQKILMEETPNLMCQIDIDGNLKFINRNFSEHFSIALNDIHYHNFFEIMDSESASLFKSGINDLTPESPEITLGLTFIMENYKTPMQSAMHGIFNEHNDLVIINITAFEE